MNEAFDVKGKVIVVTGAAGGIGSAMVLELSESGAKLAITGRRADKLQELAAQCKNECLVVPGDLSSLDEINRIVSEIKNHYGTIDVLLNCAGANVRKPFLEVLPEDYDKVMDVNVKATYFFAQAAAKVMAENKHGKIINFASMNTYISLSTVSIYAASKGAVGQLTKAMAVDLARYGIQVNAIAPGFIQTPFNELLWGNPEKNAWVAERTLQKRFGVPEDLTGTIHFLCSSASDFITGQTIPVDGGFLAGQDTLFG